MGHQLERIFTAVHDSLSWTIHAAGPWAVPMVVAAAGLIAMVNRDRLLSGFGVFLVFATAAVVTVVLAFQSGRI